MRILIPSGDLPVSDSWQTSEATKPAQRGAHMLLARRTLSRHAKREREPEVLFVPVTH
jgi:hypothetical protein